MNQTNRDERQNLLTEQRDILTELRDILTELRVVRADADITGLPLLGPGGVTDSLTAVRLMAEVERRFHVDIKNDLNLDCMETTDTLAAFIRRNTPTKSHVIGQHWIIDCSRCPAELLDSPEAVKDLIRAAAHASETRILHEAYHRYTPEGVTGFAIVSASHIAVHTWPERGYMGIDLFTCRAVDGEILEKAVKEWCAGAVCRRRVLERVSENDWKGLAPCEN